MSGKNPPLISARTPSKDDPSCAVTVISKSPSTNGSGKLTKISLASMTTSQASSSEACNPPKQVNPCADKPDIEIMVDTSQINIVLFPKE